jgi:hypothetical protein
MNNMSDYDRFSKGIQGTLRQSRFGWEEAVLLGVVFILLYLLIRAYSGGAAPGPLKKRFPSPVVPMAKVTEYIIGLFPFKAEQVNMLKEICLRRKLNNILIFWTSAAESMRAWLLQDDTYSDTDRMLVTRFLDYIEKSQKEFQHSTGFSIGQDYGFLVIPPPTGQNNEAPHPFKIWGVIHALSPVAWIVECQSIPAIDFTKAYEWRALSKFDEELQFTFVKVLRTKRSFFLHLALRQPDPQTLIPSA